MSDTCAVADCPAPLKRGGYCYGHYMKNWRYGTPTPQHPDRHQPLAGARFGTLTVLQRVASSRWMCKCDCGNTRVVRTGDLNRTGAGNTCGDKHNHLAQYVDYGSAHDRVRSQHGSASRHTCVTCGGPAEQWSYNHDDPDELISGLEATAGMAYSLDPRHYSPRCISCHRRFDLDRLEAIYGRRGRPRKPLGGNP